MAKDYTLKDYEAEDFTGYTTAELRQKLILIYSISAGKLLDALKFSDFKGSAAVCTIMERARLELKSVADVGEEDNKAGWSLGFLPDSDTDEINA
jgi:hypothetical protein